VADRLRKGGRAILEANGADVARFRATGSASAAFVDRLTLTEKRLEGVAQAVLDIARQDDPVGAITGLTRRPNGILVGQVAIPLGVIAMIYEARPNVTVDAAALCIKSGNAVLLRGGSEAAESNQALGNLLRNAIQASPEGSQVDASVFAEGPLGGSPRSVDTMTSKARSRSRMRSSRTCGTGRFSRASAGRRSKLKAHRHSAVSGRRPPRRIRRTRT